MKAGVTKQQFVKSLETTLKLTREEIESLELKDDSTVIIHYKGNHSEAVNIPCNSAIAIIRDVCKYI